MVDISITGNYDATSRTFSNFPTLYGSMKTPLFQMFLFCFFFWLGFDEHKHEKMMIEPANTWDFSDLTSSKLLR